MRSELGRRLLRAAPLIIFISLATLGMERLGWLDRFETAGIDTALLLRAPRASEHVSIVGINEDDYARLFNRRSPLNPRGLRDIINVVAVGGASVIAVDVDTSDPSFAKMSRSRAWPPIVWGVDATESDDRFAPFAALGGAAVKAPDRAAISVMPEDSDGAVRRYRRILPLKTGKMDSFAWASILQFCRAPNAQCPSALLSERVSDEPVLLNFTGERYSWSALSAGTLLAANTPAFASSKPFLGKIVIIGGFYREGRDVVVTPLGQMPGVFVMAQAMESELGGSIRPFPDLLAFLVDLLVGCSIVVVHSLFRVRPALIISVLAIPALSLLGSFLAFATFSRWFNFAPMVVGVLIHELYDHAAATVWRSPTHPAQRRGGKKREDVE